MRIFKNTLISSLRVETPTSDPEDPQSHQLTILFNESAWGEQWNKATVPAYNDVASFQKHLLSMCCFSLKGFKKHSYQHVMHFLPNVRTKFWIRGLLECLLETQGMMDDTKHLMQTQQRVLQLLGCSKRVVMAENKFVRRWIHRVSRRHLATQLMKVNTDNSNKKLPHHRPDNSSLTVAFNM